MKILKISVGIILLVVFILSVIRMARGAWPWQPDPFQIEVDKMNEECTKLGGILNLEIGCISKSSLIYINN